MAINITDVAIGALIGFIVHEGGRIIGTSISKHYKNPNEESDRKILEIIEKNRKEQIDAIIKNRKTIRSMGTIQDAIIDALKTLIKAIIKICRGLPKTKAESKEAETLSTLADSQLDAVIRTQARDAMIEEDLEELK